VFSRSLGRIRANLTARSVLVGAAGLYFNAQLACVKYQLGVHLVIILEDMRAGSLEGSVRRMSIGVLHRRSSRFTQNAYISKVGRLPQTCPTEAPKRNMDINQVETQPKKQPRSDAHGHDEKNTHNHGDTSHVSTPDTSYLKIVKDEIEEDRLYIINQFSNRQQQSQQFPAGTECTE